VTNQLAQERSHKLASARLLLAPAAVVRDVRKSKLRPDRILIRSLMNVNVTVNVAVNGQQSTCRGLPSRLRASCSLANNAVSRATARKPILLLLLLLLLLSLSLSLSLSRCLSLSFGGNFPTNLRASASFPVTARTFRFFTLAFLYSTCKISARSIQVIFK